MSRTPVQTHRPLRHSARPRGFTLLEILVALSLMGIVLSLALPWFFDSIRKGRRSEAVSAMATLQQAQERRRANEPSYTSDLALLVPAATTVSGYYTLAVNSANAVSYTATATAAGSQDKDNRCHQMRVQVTGGNIAYGSACKGCSFSVPMTDANRCWSRQ